MQKCSLTGFNYLNPENSIKVVFYPLPIFMEIKVVVVVNCLKWDSETPSLVQESEVIDTTLCCVSCVLHDGPVSPLPLVFVESLFFILNPDS